MVIRAQLQGSIRKSRSSEGDEVDSGEATRSHLSLDFHPINSLKKPGITAIGRTIRNPNGHLLDLSSEAYEVNHPAEFHREEPAFV